MSARTLDRHEAREHYESGGVLHELNKAGTLAHIRMGWNGSGGYCGKVGSGPYAELPPGVRVCKTCTKAHDKARTAELRDARNDALSAGIRVQAKRERCQLCYVALPHDDVWCADTPIRGDWLAFRELVKEATTPGEVWLAFKMFASDDEESM